MQPLESQVLAQLESLKKDSNTRSLFLQKHHGTTLIIQDSALLNLASNDYLGLSSDKDFNQRFLDSTLFKEHCYFSSSSSRLLSGNFEIYTLLESHLKTLFGKESLLFNSGYHANIGAISALSALNVLFVADKSIHASHIDGLKGFKTPNFKRFSHNDMESLKKILEQNVECYDSIIILSEGLFSMEGDFTPLLDLIALKKSYPNVYLYIDEAHSIGSFGKNGLGLCANLGVLKDIDFLILTFGKALSSMGACVLCNTIFKDYFINTARALIYSTALPPINIARTLFVFLELSKLEEKREVLATLCNSFKTSLQENLDLEILGDYNIISLVLGQNAKAIHFSKSLAKEGYFAPAIKTPSVPKNKALLRFSLTANLESKPLENLVKILQKITYATP
ncbi:aminotransferase class I/II-fold pyridoxal phosphate-dependent enzyme [Helicobacter sp. MIT 11-5569]|uniref:aminotransferase class I/II-fold pyridoxal phosphate-dependent enzyme n=1 Tax=Helicobacter sp. MIT 11-5569 TaxID=1548151 RepID=UPI00051FAFC5|nr:aminotransferase class I/II-fold pyridoxal phosphate-dependent enzyme [Helicobacter sp. MIT 11-5569]TLD82942.1 aminotransferase class I/II-fold pyridoxal phosphate-dependent enzyme [Helicobacter sp. MIT 11-5569]